MNRVRLILGKLLNLRNITLGLHGIEWDHFKFH